VKISEADETIRPPSALFTKLVKLSPVVDSQTIGFSMSAFGDLMTLQFLQDAFVTDFLTTKVGLSAIFNAAYDLTDLQLHDLTLASVDRKTFQSPTFESIRITGTHERITPSMERSQIERSMKRFGRLVWVEVQLDLTLATKVQQLAMPIDSIRTANLIEDLGGVTSLADLRTKLQTRYSPSVVDAMFKALRIGTLGDFQERMNLLVQLFFKPAPAFDPADPAVRFYDLPTRPVPRITRQFRFERGNGQWQINGRFMDCDRIRFTVNRNSAERWILQNNSGGWQHPIHIHLEEFQIVKHNGRVIQPGDVEFSRKDVVQVGFNDQVELVMRFRDFRGDYPMHCHNTIHEDHAMMLLWAVQDDANDNNTNP